ncbi:RNA 2',3'-cyclic phosphodiesterase [Rugamonas apoptosis]|uniref:RNA 2',3'-cyclic phosphodiesterase n=1 Tax=Rugamonas apoptosis TaxID=2758570 RepID=A0A7W2FDM5_9BURK|nr:RNA 2',3'-cyclic phosphodiesterase [Rugamonas apoptosis]MBA5689785.1 RNA 2',3'-cyclic phosphodiesterase [Rugamonas apoptosis]
MFFALWPEPAERDALAPWQTLVRGRPVVTANLHLTLAFLGWQPAAAVAPLMAILDELSVPPLRLEFDMLGYFSGQRIAWAGMRAPPPALLALQEQLTGALARAGFTADSHGPFRPHVTLTRHAPAPEALITTPVIWQHAQVALMRSGTPDGVYRVLRARRH